MPRDLNVAHIEDRGDECAEAEVRGDEVGGADEPRTPSPVLAAQDAAVRFVQHQMDDADHPLEIVDRRIRVSADLTARDSCRRGGNHRLRTRASPGNSLANAEDEVISPL